MAHLDHPDPILRQQVALGLGHPRPEAERLPEVLAAVLRLAEDPEPRIRATALSAFLLSPLDTPALRTTLVAHLADPDHDARREAAGALVLRGDERGRPVLDGIRAARKNLYSRDAGWLDTFDHLLRSRRA
nr:HEAT repeat domain-containing protein [Kitasatospora sp. MMS16-BH015]